MLLTHPVKRIIIGITLLLSSTALATNLNLPDDPVFDEPVTLVTRNNLSLPETLELLGLSIGYTVFTKGVPPEVNNVYDFNTPRSFRSTLDLITRLYNLEVVVSDDILIIAPEGELTDFTETSAAEADEEETTVTYSPENYEEIHNLLQQAQPDIRIIAVPAARALMITGTEAQHERVTALITEFDERITANQQEEETTTRLYNLTANATTVRELLTETHPNLTTVLLPDMNSLSITMPASKEAEITNYIQELEDRQAALAPQRASYRINNAQANALAATMSQSFEAQGYTALVMADERTNTLTVVGTREVQQLAQNIIEELDVREKQVRVRVRIHEVSTSEAERLGVNIAAGVGTLTANVLDAGLNLIFNPSRVINALTINATLDTLEEQSLARSIDDANILMLNNTTSQITSGGTIELVIDGGDVSGTTQSINFGTTLTVNPQISNDGFITLDLNVALSGFEGELSNVTGLRFTEQAINSTVQVPDGGIVVLGGLIQEGITVTQSGVPFLKDLPIIGTFFRTTNNRVEESELIITLEVNLEDPAESNATHAHTNE